LFKQVAITH